MKHECKITVLETKCFTDYQEKYLANPKSGACPFFKVGDEFLLKRTPEQDDFYHLMNGKFCGEAWDAISRYVYTALQGGSIMKGWTNDDRVMIACCNDEIQIRLINHQNFQERSASLLLFCKKEEYQLVHFLHF